MAKIFPEGWLQFLLILLFSLAWIPVIYQYLDCGILANGFARVKCKGCGHEYLLDFSCKRRHFCPSCHAKRVVEFGEWLCSNVLKSVPHRHFVFSIPKIIRNKRKMNFNYCIIADNQYKKGCNKSWARLIKKIYEVNPLTCPKCGGHMRIIAFT